MNAAQATQSQASAKRRFRPKAAAEDEWRNIPISLIDLKGTLTTTSQVRTKIRLGVAAFVIVWTILVHAQSHWNPILAYPLYPGNMVHLLVTGGHGGTLTQEKIGFAAELATNLLVYLAATFILLRVRSSK